MQDLRLAFMQLRTHTAATCLAALVIGYAAATMVPELFTYDQEPDTYHFVLPYVFDCDPSGIEREGSLTRNPLKWWLNCASYQTTGNYRLIPGAFGIAIMPLVYLLGYYITSDRLIGIISLVAFINNPLYSDWATSGTYDQVWAFFLLLSVVFVFKNKVHYGVMSFMASFFAKTLAIMYLPALLYTVYKKTGELYHVMLLLLALSIAGFVFTSMFDNIGGAIGTDIGFYPERWEDAIYRNISLFWQIIPFAVFVVINRTFIPTVKMPNQKTVVVWMLLIFLQNPLIYLFTTQDTYAYRYVPLAAFMSVFIGMTLVNLGNWFVESKLGKATQIERI